MSPNTVIQHHHHTLPLTPPTLSLTFQHKRVEFQPFLPSLTLKHKMGGSVSTTSPVLCFDTREGVSNHLHPLSHKNTRWGTSVPSTSPPFHILMQWSVFWPIPTLPCIKAWDQVHLCPPQSPVSCSDAMEGIFDHLLPSIMSKHKTGAISIHHTPCLVFQCNRGHIHPLMTPPLCQNTRWRLQCPLHPPSCLSMRWSLFIFI